MKGPQPESIPAGSPDQELSPELREQLDTLIADASSCYNFPHQVNWDRFQEEWESHNVIGKNDMVAARKVWLKLKEEGDATKDLLMQKIREDVASENGEAYQHFQIYKGLFGTGDYRFLGELLDHEAVWNNQDCSLALDLSLSIGATKSGEVAQMLRKYAGHILSPDYKRRFFVASDLGPTVGAIASIMGRAPAAEAIEELAESNPLSKQWFEKNNIKANIKNKLFGGNFSVENFASEEFDPALEHERLTKLEQEVENLEKNPPEEDDQEPWDESLDTWDDNPNDFTHDPIDQREAHEEEAVIQSPAPNYLSRAEEMMTAEQKVMSQRREAEQDAQSEDPKRREHGYYVLSRLARRYKYADDTESAEQYQTVKQLLENRIFQEQDRPLRKSLVSMLANLASDGCDGTIANDFAEMVKKESVLIKTRKRSKREILSPEGMDIIRGLFILGDEDATRAVWDLIANPQIDPRLKKLCLNNLNDSKGIFPSDLSRYVRRDLSLPSQKINWKDYAALYKIQKISSSNIRAGPKRAADGAFISIRDANKSISELNGEVAPALPPEFFLSLYRLLDGDNERIKKWNKLFEQIKSTKLKESFLFSISNMFEYDTALISLITEKIIDAPQITKEHIALADRLLRKIHPLVFLNKTVKSLSEASLNRGGAQQATGPDVKSLLREMKAPSLLEIKLDEMIVSALYEITNRGDLSSTKIQTIFNAWEDPEPIFIYFSKLAPYRDMRNYRRSLDLMGEMLAHMDPPNFEEWKQWRYFNDDEFAPAQLHGLSREQKEAYAEDEFVDLGDVLVGLLPSDKPVRIREEIVHDLRHDWRDGSVGLPMENARGLWAATNGEGSVDFESLAGADLEMIDTRIRLMDRRVNLQEDLRIFELLPQQVRTWRDSENRKREALAKAGFTGSETREEIEAEIVKLKKSKPGSKDINLLASLKPAEPPVKTRKFLEKYDLPATADASVLESLKIRLQKELQDMDASEDLGGLVKEVFGGKKEISAAEWQEAIKKLKAVQIILRLGMLTPQLIAFNRLLPGKKKETLRSSIEWIKRNFEDNAPLLSAVGRIEAVINEESHPIGKDPLAVVFTDSPIAALTIGKFPRGATSCQNYEGGSTVLAAYMADAYTKMCLLIDLSKLSSEINDELEKAEGSAEKMKVFNNHTLAFLNASVGRRLTKIVQNTEDDRPRLFLEPVYTPLDRKSTARLLNAFAVTTLEPKIGIPLVRGGGGETVRVSGSRNGSQYEDGESGGPGGEGAGIGTMSGAYTMPAQPLQQKDYLITPSI